MAQQVKLRHKGNTLDLSAAPYSIGLDFVPLASSSDDVIASGSSANTYGGGVLAGRKYTDRAWSFSIRVNGTARNDITAAIRKLASMLQLAGTSDTPLYLDYRNDTAVPEPLWGQFGAAATYEVIAGRVGDVWNEYGIDMIRDETVFVTVEVTVKPFQKGSKQIVAIATGGIFDNTFGRVDTIPGGVTISEATTNKMTNPVFGHATFGNNWTAAADITAEENTDNDFLLPGTFKSARLFYASGGNNTYTQSINVGNTNKHSIGCIIKRYDSAAINASTEIALFYNSNRTATAVALGNGWYWMKAENIDGVASAQNTGVVIITSGIGVHYYLAAVQIEEKAYCTFPAWGDMLGCAWTGTVHASTSTRTAASCKVPISSGVLNAAQGSIRAVVRFDVPNTTTNSIYIIDTRDGSHTGAIVIFFDPTDDKIYLQTNTTTFTTSAALTFSAGTIYTIHATWSNAGAVLYINGAQVDTDASYVINALGANMFIGSNYSTANHLPGSMLGLATFDRALTAAQVLADYNSIAPIVARSDRVESVPWFWTDDGDNVLSLDTGKTPLGVAGGIDGNMPAITEIQGQLSNDGDRVGSVVMSNFALPVPIKISDLLFDVSGTALVGDYGGEHKETSLTSSAGTILVSSGGTLSAYASSYINSIEYQMLLRTRAGTAATVSFYNAYSAGSVIQSSAKVAVLGAAYYAIMTNALIIDNSLGFTDVSRDRLRVYPYGGVSSGTVNVYLDYYAMLPTPTVILSFSAATSNAFVYLGDKAYDRKTTAPYYLSSPINVTGSRPIEFENNQYNHLQMYFGVNTTVDPTITLAGTITAIYITPRWSVL